MSDAKSNLLCRNIMQTYYRDTIEILYQYCSSTIHRSLLWEEQYSPHLQDYKIENLSLWDCDHWDIILDGCDIS